MIKGMIGMSPHAVYRNGGTIVVDGALGTVTTGSARHGTVTTGSGSRGTGPIGGPGGGILVTGSKRMSGGTVGGGLHARLTGARAMNMWRRALIGAAVQALLIAPPSEAQAPSSQRCEVPAASPPSCFVHAFVWALGAGNALWAEPDTRAAEGADRYADIIAVARRQNVALQQAGGMLMAYRHNQNKSVREAVEMAELGAALLTRANDTILATLTRLLDHEPGAAEQGVQVRALALVKSDRRSARDAFTLAVASLVSALIPEGQAGVLALARRERDEALTDLRSLFGAAVAGPPPPGANDFAIAGALLYKSLSEPGWQLSSR